MDDPVFTTIQQHWNHFLERDMPPAAPPEQVFMMKQAFAAGAASGLHLAVAANRDARTIAGHVEDIKTLNFEAQSAYRGPRG